jgi:hypothetical protein
MAWTYREPVQYKDLNRLQLPYYCSRCDVHKEICHGCFRPLRTHAFSEQSITKIRVSNADSKHQEKDSSTPNTGSGERNKMQSGQLWSFCTGCDPKHGTAKQEGYRTCNNLACKACRSVLPLPKDRHEQSARRGWSLLCLSCEAFCVSGAFQRSLKSNDGQSVFWIAVNDYESLYHSECDFCRVIANAIDAWMRRMMYLGTILVQTHNSKPVIPVYLYREGDRLKVMVVEENRSNDTLLSLTHLTDIYLTTAPG